MSKLRIIPLGGMGNVTQNMYIYEYDQEMMIVDCGIGFPDRYMPGVDILIPDITYILKQLEAGKKIVGMILTHGHDDHIAATPYILPRLPEFPIYASPLTAGFVRDRLSDSEAADWPITVTKERTEYKVGSHFSFKAFAMTHSVPDTRHFAINTPEGVIYHGTDFKLDPSPIDGVLPDFDFITQLGKEGVLCMLLDCLRVERQTWTKSEATTGPAIEAELQDVKGKYIITLMSSHIHRIQQVVDIAVRHQRKLAFIGRSVEQNVRVARELGKLIIPNEAIIDKRDMEDYRDDQLCLVIAGSQGQEGSSLVRAVFGEHPDIQIKPADKVIFSADAIPGNEISYYAAVDELCRNGIDVVYPEIAHDIHQSGHGSAPEQSELVRLVKPKYIMPIGGQDRHRIKFIEFVAEPLGYSPDQVIVPAHGEVLAFEHQHPSVDEKIHIQAVNVDGLGIGDVGPVVLSDRKALSQAGIIVIVIPRVGKDLSLERIEVVSRGFVYMREADEVIEFIKEETVAAIEKAGKKANENDIKHQIERHLSKRIHKVIRRQPLILPVFIDV